MRSRLFAVVVILCIVIAVIWEMRRPPPPPVMAPISLSGPVVHEIPTPPQTPIAFKKVLPKNSKPPITRKIPPAVVVSVHNASVPATPPLVARPPVPAVPLTSVPEEPKEWSGNSDTSIKHPGQIVVQNDHQWIRFWSEHHPDEAAPEIDFSKNMVVGVFQGRRPADGFKVRITGIRTLSDTVFVDYVEFSPPPGTFQMGVEVYPYDVKVVPRSTLHVKFNQLTAQYAVSPYQHPAPSTAPAPTPVAPSK